MTVEDIDIIDVSADDGDTNDDSSSVQNTDDSEK